MPYFKHGAGDGVYAHIQKRTTTERLLPCVPRELYVWVRNWIDNSSSSFCARAVLVEALAVFYGPHLKRHPDQESAPGVCDARQLRSSFVIHFPITEGVRLAFFFPLSPFNSISFYIPLKLETVSFVVFLNWSKKTEL